MVTPSGISGIIKWTAPPMRCLKVNIDGSWSDTKLVGGFEVVVRNDLGEFVAATCGSFEGV